jgi:cytochrome P450
MTDATRSNGEDIYYDPFDVAIDRDPHPLWRRMRDEAPLYHNDKYGFWAVSRYEDVERALVEWDTYRSGRGSVLEYILANIEIPPGMILFEDPPIHDIHRGLLSRVFTPKAMTAIEPKVREFCARTLDPLVGSGGFDFVRDLGAVMPMLTIGMLLGIPEHDQQLIRDRIHRSLRVDDDSQTPSNDVMSDGGAIFGEYIDWRAKNPSDDLMTRLLNTEFEDEHGSTRLLTRDEVLGYVLLLAGAGNDTTTKLIGWLGKLLAEHPDQRREIAVDRSLVPNAVEETLRYEAPSPVQARLTSRPVELHGHVLPEGTVMVILNGSGNRDDRHFPDADRYDIHRSIDHHLSFGYGLHFCLGAALARLEGRIALDEVLKRWPEWEVDWDNAEQSHTSTTRGWERLPVITN